MNQFEDIGVEEDLEEIRSRLDAIEWSRRAKLMKDLGLHALSKRTSDEVSELVESELALMTPSNAELLRPFLAKSSHFHIREWDYGHPEDPPDSLFLPCWWVAFFPAKEEGIVYSDHGHSGDWGIVKDNGFCGPDAAWSRSFGEAIWRSHLLDGYVPTEANLDDWVGAVRHLSPEKFAQATESAVADSLAEREGRSQEDGSQSA